ncbi:hypothetical protein SISNIDRAFT_471588 [Sistotremastrum niveocremeum HHB9708]|uniref:Uncharacterized protein n=1 Tax=Sistotremastrum niveocremeum HHB9708 TaxID=1314777 RepID=A0A164MGF8_9AGAM|nr:hypothetical protein SISNIDRAFT_471588 [Sistotremastrum niveocremeum HHB9708]
MQFSLRVSLFFLFGGAMRRSLALELIIKTNKVEICPRPLKFYLSKPYTRFEYSRRNAKINLNDKRPVLNIWIPQNTLPFHPIHAAAETTAAEPVTADITDTALIPILAAANLALPTSPETELHPPLAQVEHTFDEPPNPPVSPHPPVSPQDVPQPNVAIIPLTGATRLWGYLNYIPEDPPRPLTPTVVDEEEDLLERLAEIEPEPLNAGEKINGDAMTIVDAHTAIGAVANHAQPAAAHAPQFLPAPPHLRGLSEEEMTQLARKNHFAFYVLSRSTLP